MKANEIIRALLSSEHISQQELAERIGKQQTHIGKYLSVTSMRCDTFRTLCEALGYKVRIDGMIYTDERDFIKALMKSRGVTQEEMAKALQTKQSTITGRLNRGKNGMWVDNAVEMLAVLGAEMSVENYIVS